MLKSITARFRRAIGGAANNDIPTWSHPLGAETRLTLTVARVDNVDRLTLIVTARGGGSVRIASAADAERLAMVLDALRPYLSREDGLSPAEHEQLYAFAREFGSVSHEKVGPSRE